MNPGPGSLNEPMLILQLRRQKKAPRTTQEIPSALPISFIDPTPGENESDALTKDFYLVSLISPSSLKKAKIFSLYFIFVFSKVAES